MIWFLSALLQCVEFQRPCNQTTPCCVSMYCYDNTQCVYNEDRRVLDNLLSRGCHIR